MFFDDIKNTQEIASKNGCSIFVLPKDELEKVNIKNALVLEPEEKSTISIEQVRKITNLLGVKTKKPQYIIIRPAEALGESAENALLKNLEEPGENYHFILLTENPSSLLPTILSRSAIYFLRTENPLDQGINTKETIKDLAKRYIVATPKDLVNLSEEIIKHKDNTRAYALEVLSTVIEMLYKSYFKTENKAFLKKIPKFLTAYENIDKNGHIKLHLVADLL